MRISDWSSDVCSSDLVDVLQVRLVGFGQNGTVADEPGVIAFDQPHALRVQAERVALLVQRLDPGEQARVQADRVAVRGKLRSVLGAQLVAYVVGLGRSEEHTSELQSLMRILYAVSCLKSKH